MKKRFFTAVLLALVVILAFGSITSLAFEPYETYTYSIDGEALQSPTAYSAVTPEYYSKDMGLRDKFGSLDLKDVSDIVTDAESNVYLADTGNNRVVVLNKYYAAVGALSTYEDENGKAQTFNKPNGIFVVDPSKATFTDKQLLYVCDTGNSRIVVFERDTDAIDAFSYRCIDTITKPDSTLVEEGDFVPHAVAVDLYGRIFMVSRNCSKGVIVMSSEGDFTGFIGTQKVSYNLITLIWRRFQSREQRAATTTTVASAYYNLTVDDEGFVYVVAKRSANDLDLLKKQLAAIKSKNADYSPVKMLNSAGKEILKRNGFFDPGGEVDVFYANEVSEIVDVSVGNEGTWSILDRKRARIFTYDNNGNLLFAFGDSGDSLGNGEAGNCQGIAYHTVRDEYGNDVTYLLMISSTLTGYKLTVYKPTLYCDQIMSALHYQNEHRYDLSKAAWEQVLTSNNNFDLAYIGIGKALYNQGRYTEAMEMLSSAYETSYYSDAFAEQRKDFLGTWLLPLLILVIAVIVLFVKFLGYAKRRNKATALKVGGKTYTEELLYSFHLNFHPFDGFWDLKHEKRGSVRAALTILGVTILAYFYQAIGKGYIFNPRNTYSTIFVQITAVGVPVLLWCVANWCLTTLFDGEGSFKDIFIATCYSLAPLPLFLILSTMLSNVLVTSEGAIVNLLVTLGYIWAAYLLFFGNLVTHDYSLGKNLLIIICTILAMAIIMFVAVLFSSLVIKMITFVVSIFTEIGNRA